MATIWFEHSMPFLFSEKSYRSKLFLSILDIYKLTKSVIILLSLNISAIYDAPLGPISLSVISRIWTVGFSYGDKEKKAKPINNKKNNYIGRLKLRAAVCLFACCGVQHILRCAFYYA